MLNAHAEWLLASSSTQRRLLVLVSLPRSPHAFRGQEHLSCAGPPRLSATCTAHRSQLQASKCAQALGAAALTGWARRRLPLPLPPLTPPHHLSLPCPRQDGSAKLAAWR